MISELKIPPQSSDTPRPAPERAGRQLRLLSQLARRVAAVRDHQTIMLTISQGLHEPFAADRASFFMHDPRKNELWTVFKTPGDKPTIMLEMADDEGLCGRCFQLREPMCVRDTFHNPHFARRLAQRIGYMPHSMLLAPVIVDDGRCAGVLEVMDSGVNLFSDSDIPLLETFAAHVGIILDQLRSYEAGRHQFKTFVAAVSAALDARDPLTTLHSINVANYAMGIATILGLPEPEIELLRTAGLLHDIGKIAVSDAVLTKPGRLTPGEFEEMKQHAEYSRVILEMVSYTPELAGLDLIASSHHEKLDGSGYPAGKSADDICLKSRIMAVADVFDALTQTRHYRRALTTHEALAEISKMTPGQLDAMCVGALKAFLGCGPWPMPT